MANKQLVQYIREQLKHRMNPDQLRTTLLQEGWAGPDIEAAIEEARVEVQRGDHKRHHTHYVGLAISGVVVLILLAALLIVVFDPGGGGAEPQPTPQDQAEASRPDLTGWEVCKNEDDSMAKHTCYYELNADNKQYDCGSIPDETERDFCYRAKEEVLLEQYQGSQA